MRCAGFGAHLNVILLECVLHRMVGGPKTMTAQLRHLADMSTLPNVTLRVLPLRAGIPLGDPLGQFIILDFDPGATVEPSVVYPQSFTGSLYLEDQNDVGHYHRAYQAIQRASLDDIASRNLIRRVAGSTPRDRQVRRRPIQCGVAQQHPQFGQPGVC
ncbi:DUF5753 domain-containing protein [Nocardia sp. CA-119907]|uniref:DUF5753 domain-containing protein n=1 Tax=Nocardia sp. CA-119907 TaxID=3239973 RepID=UPI003D9776E5